MHSIIAYDIIWYRRWFCNNTVNI